MKTIKCTVNFFPSLTNIPDVMCVFRFFHPQSPCISNIYRKKISSMLTPRPQAIIVFLGKFSMLTHNIWVDLISTYVCLPHCSVHIHTHIHIFRMENTFPIKYQYTSRETPLNIITGNFSFANRSSANVISCLFVSKFYVYVSDVARSDFPKKHLTNCRLLPHIVRFMRNNENSAQITSQYPRSTV